MPPIRSWEWYAGATDATTLTQNWSRRSRMCGRTSQCRRNCCPGAMSSNSPKVAHSGGITDERKKTKCNFSFVNAIDRIARHDYVPTLQDILMLRITTTGIIEARKYFENRINENNRDLGEVRDKESQFPCVRCRRTKERAEEMDTLLWRKQWGGKDRRRRDKKERKIKRRDKRKRNIVDVGEEMDKKKENNEECIVVEKVSMMGALLFFH